MALGTYTGLLDAVASWLNRTDLTATIPDFVLLAEARIARDLRLRAQVAQATLTTTSAVQTLAVPADLLEIDNITLTASGIDRPLQSVTPEMMDVLFPLGLRTGVPATYSISGDTFFLGPTPDGAYPITLRYFQRLPALSVTPTNWLLTRHPGVYLWATLAEAGPFLLDAERTQLYEAKYRAEFESLRDADLRATQGGSAMRVRAV